MVRIIGKWMGRLLLALLAIAVVLWVWKREEITRLFAVLSLFEEAKIVTNFSNMDTLFATAPISRGTGDVVPLPAGAALTPPDGFEDWLERRAVTGMMVLKDGNVRHEAYLRGTSEDDRRIGWSISKSYLSTLLGILIDEGAIGSLDDRAADYALQLAGSGYDQATIGDILQMTSGIVFDEDYLDFFSDINKMGRILALGGKMDDFAASRIQTFAAPGEKWKYTSIDTHALAMVIRAASGETLPELLSDKIVAKLGQDRDGYYVTDGTGVAFALGGLALTLRDYGRFAQMVLQQGKWQGEQIVPADWLATSTVPNGLTKPGKLQYGGHWWMPSDAHPGELMARGVYGQYLYIDRDAQVVIVVSAADRNFRETGAATDSIDMFRRIVTQLKE